MNLREFDHNVLQILGLYFWKKKGNLIIVIAAKFSTCTRNVFWMNVCLYHLVFYFTAFDRRKFRHKGKS